MFFCMLLFFKFCFLVKIKMHELFECGEALTIACTIILTLYIVTNLIVMPSDKKTVLSDQSVFSDMKTCTHKRHLTTTKTPSREWIKVGLSYSSSSSSWSVSIFSSSSSP